MKQQAGIDKIPEWCVDDTFWQEIDPLIFPSTRIDLAPQEVSEILKCAPQAGLHVLDVGCGPGRHCSAFARLGHTVIGIDQSAYLLQKAHTHAEKNGVKVDFRHLDMREIDFSSCMDLAVCLYSSFGYFPQPDDDFQVVKNIYRSLKPGGKFVLDIGSKETIARHFAPLQRFSETDQGSFLHRIVVDGWEFVDLKWYLHRNGGFKIYTTRIRLYSGSELTLLLKNAGFSRVHLYGSFSGAAFDSDATRLIAVAEKS